MKIFLLDLWHDLREKRLWPVAVALLAGLVAVPVLLAKPAGEPASPPPQSAAADASQAKSADEKLAALARVRLGEESGSAGSTLGVFRPDDPFTPPKGTIKKDKAESATAGGSGPGSESQAGDDAPTGDTSGGTSGGGTPTTPGDTGGDTGGSDTPTTTVTYKYVVDVTFSANGRTRRIHGLEKLDMLPNQSSPLLIFMGVTPKGSDAVFLVDSTLDAAGEGRCKPSPSDCAFAYVGAGAEHVFTDESGDTYTLRIDEIRKVKVSASGANSGAKAGTTAEASVGSPRRFVPPVLADIVVVASDSLDDSNSQTDRR